MWELAAAAEAASNAAGSLGPAVIAAAASIAVVVLNSAVTVYTLRLQLAASEEQRKATAELEVWKKQSDEKLEVLRQQHGGELLDHKAEIEALQQKASRTFELEQAFVDEYERYFRDLRQASKNAIKAVQQLATEGRTGRLSSKPLTVGKPPFFDIVYSLAAPVALQKVIQERARSKWHVIKANHEASLQYAFAETLEAGLLADGTIAELSPDLQYASNLKASERQRLSVRRLIDLLIVRNNHDEAVDIAHIDQLLDDYSGGKLRPYLVDAKRIFTKFDPASSGIFWRILIAQVYLHRGIVQAETEQASREQVLARVDIPADERHLFDWRSSGSTVTSGDVLESPFASARDYVKSLDLKLDGTSTC